MSETKLETKDYYIVVAIPRMSDYDAEGEKAPLLYKRDVKLYINGVENEDVKNFILEVGDGLPRLFLNPLKKQPAARTANPEGFPRRAR